MLYIFSFISVLFSNDNFFKTVKQQHDPDIVKLVNSENLEQAFNVINWLGKDSHDTKDKIKYRNLMGKILNICVKLKKYDFIKYRINDIISVCTNNSKEEGNVSIWFNDSLSDIGDAFKHGIKANISSFLKNLTNVGPDMFLMDLLVTISYFPESFVMDVNKDIWEDIFNDILPNIEICDSIFYCLDLSKLLKFDLDKKMLENRVRYLVKKCIDEKNYSMLDSFSGCGKLMDFNIPVWNMLKMKDGDKDDVKLED